MNVKVQTKGSHYVWRKYLEAFCDSNGAIHVKKKSGDAFKSIPAKVGFENHIYTLTNKIQPKDIELFCTFFRLKLEHDTERRYLETLVKFLNNELPLLFEDKKYASVLNKFKPTDNEHGKQELLFTFYENNFGQVLDMLYNKDASFYNDLLADTEKTYLGMSAFRIIKTDAFFSSVFISEFMRRSKPEKESALKLVYSYRDRTKKAFEELFGYDPSTTFKAHHFLMFLWTQYFRTRRMANVILPTIEEYNQAKGRDFNERANGHC